MDRVSSFSLVVSIVAWVASALIKLLGVEPTPMDLARVLNSVVAEAAESPMAPLVAALYARLPGRPLWSIYVVEAGAGLPRGEEIMATIDQVRQITIGLGALIGRVVSDGLG